MTKPNYQPMATVTGDHHIETGDVEEHDDIDQIHQQIKDKLAETADLQRSPDQQAAADMLAAATHQAATSPQPQPAPPSLLTQPPPQIHPATDEDWHHFRFSVTRLEAATICQQQLGEIAAQTATMQEIDGILIEYFAAHIPQAPTVDTWLDRINQLTNHTWPQPDGAA